MEGGGEGGGGEGGEGREGGGRERKRVSVERGYIVCPGLRSRLQRIAQEVAARRIGYNKRKPPPVSRGSGWGVGISVGSILPVCISWETDCSNHTKNGWNVCQYFSLRGYRWLLKVLCFHTVKLQPNRATTKLLTPG